MIFCGGFSKRKYIWGYNYDLCRANKETGLVLRFFNIILYNIQRQILISILGYFLTVVGAPRFTFLKTTTEGRRRENQFSPLVSIIYLYNIWHEAGIRILVCCRVVWAIMLDLGFHSSATWIEGPPILRPPPDPLPRLPPSCAGLVAHCQPPLSGLGLEPERRELPPDQLPSMVGHSGLLSTEFSSCPSGCSWGVFPKTI